MTNKTITGLTAATTPVAGTELVPVWDGTDTKKVTIANFGPGLSGIAPSAVTGTALVAAAIGNTVQAYDADLVTWAGITPAANIGTFLATPSSANLRSALTDETGTGAAVFADAPQFATGIGIGATAAGAGGIAFPATAVAVADANTLDDYEEGTFTPTLSGATTTTYTTQLGTYTKIGRKVTFQCELTVNSLGDGSTSAIVLGSLPNCNGTYYGGCHVVYFSGLATNIVFSCAYISPSGHTATFASMTAAASGLSGTALFTNGSRMIFSGSYEV
jgi:hypothetical protein